MLVKLAKEEKLPYPIQTFAIGAEDSPDIMAARKVKPPTLRQTQAPTEIIYHGRYHQSVCVSGSRTHRQ